MDKDTQKKSIQDLLGGEKKKKKIVIKKSAPGVKKNLVEQIQKVQDEKKQTKPKPAPSKPAAKAPAPQPAKKPAPPPKPAAAQPPKKAPAPQAKAQGRPAQQPKAAGQGQPKQGQAAGQSKPAPRKPRISFEMPDKKQNRGKARKPGENRGGGRSTGGDRNDNRTKNPDIATLNKPGALEYAQRGFKAPARKGGAFAKRKGGGKKKQDRGSQSGQQMPRKKEEKVQLAIPKEIEILENVTVGELARKLNVKASFLIGKMMKMGIMGTINDVLDTDTATLLAEELGAEVKIISLYDETLIKEEEGKQEDVKSRAPIITVMGHVDHGKTKLLDTIRSQDVVATEAGGITQHIGAYKVSTKQGDLVFLDTPGHEAFTAMRARGSGMTDIVILVVAADDGVMPQTIEAINHAKAAEVPIIVALNKVDKPEANPKKVQEALAAYDLVPEDWGGQTQYVEISALQGTGIDKLLEAIMLQAELLELKANAEVRASGTVVEARLDPGRGPVSTVLVQRGTLKQGDPVLAGRFSGRVRAIFNDREERLDEAGPSTPVEILGIEGVPDAGDPVQVLESEKEAKNVSAKRHELDRLNQSSTLKRMSLDDLNDMVAEGEMKDLNVIVKADVHGSVEAIQESLRKLSDESENVNIRIVHAQTGGIIESDVMLASASDAVILGFHVRPNAKATVLAEKEQVQVKYYSVIYNLLEDIEKAMHGLLEPTYEERILGEAEIRELFKISKVGTVAGCKVNSGKIKKNASCRVIRDGVVVHDGSIKTLRRIKDDVNEVGEGFECGIFLESYNDLKIGDTIEAFEMAAVQAKL